MPAYRHLLSGFLGGELDPMMSGRVDTDNYAYGLDTCENFIALAIGPLVKRSGCEYIRDAAATASWLSAFRFSITQEYVIEWSNATARFFTNGGRIETAPNVPYELTVPYTAAEAPALSLQQSYDRLYLAHGSHAPAAIARTSAVTFSFAALDLQSGPFADANSDETVTLTASATTGSGVTLTASSAIFVAGEVGSLINVEAKDFSDIKAWEPGMDAITAGEIVRSDGKAYTALTSGKTGTLTPTHTSGAEWDGQLKNDVLNAKGPYGVKWEYRHDKFGVARITAIGGGGTTATVDVVRRLPDSVTSVATFRWAKAAISAAAGWPSLVTLAFGRMVLIKDFDVIGSVVGDFGGGRVNFQSFTSSGMLAVDLAFRRTLATTNPPIWAVADLASLLVGTADKELAVAPTNPQAALSGDNIKSTPQSFYGSEAVAPVQIGVQTTFVERGGRRLRSAGYDFTRDRYAADDITAAARHMTQSGLVQLAYQRIPWALLHAVRADGRMITHSDTKEALKGFSHFIPGGAARVLSAVSVVGADAKVDELWLLVERTRADGVKREIWRQVPQRDLGDDQAEAFFVDAGVRIEASGGQTVFTGLTHLAGQAVAVLAGGGVVPGMTVSGAGVLTLPPTSVPADPYVAVVGLGYTALAVTLPPEIPSQRGTLQGLLKRARKAVLRVLETIGIKVGGNQPGDPLEEAIDRSADDLMDAPVPLFTGDTNGRIDTSFDTAGRMRIVSSDPTPAIVTAAMLSLEVDTADA